MPVIALWSAPRARSTAFFRSMVERGDLLALHEPFWNLTAFGDAGVPGQVLPTTTSLLAWLGDETPNIKVFFKETTDQRYEEVLAGKRFLAEARHVFLIRHSRRHRRFLPPTVARNALGGGGAKTMHELYAAVVDAGSHRPVAIDADDLATRPAAGFRTSEP